MDRQQFISIKNLHRQCSTYLQEFDEIVQRVDVWTESLKRDVQRLLNKDSKFGPVIPSTPAALRLQRKRLSVISELADEGYGGTTDDIPCKKNDKIQKENINCDTLITTVQKMDTDVTEENSNQNKVNEVFKRLSFDVQEEICEERGSEISKNCVKKAKISSSCSRPNLNAEEITQYIVSEESSVPVGVENGEETLKTKTHQRSLRYNEITTETSLQRNSRTSEGEVNDCLIEIASSEEQALPFPSEKVVRKSKRLQKSSTSAAKTLDRRNTRTRRSTTTLDQLVLALPHSLQNFDEVESLTKSHNSLNVNELPFPSKKVEVTKVVRKSKRLQKSSTSAAKTLDRRNTRTRSTTTLDQLVLALPHSLQNFDEVESLTKSHNSLNVNELATRSSIRSIKSLKLPEPFTNEGTLSPAEMFEAEGLQKSSQNSKEDSQTVTKTSYQRTLNQPVSITEETLTHSVEDMRRSPRSQNKKDCTTKYLGKRNTRPLNKLEVIQASSIQKSLCSQRSIEIVSKNSDCSLKSSPSGRKSNTDQSSLIDSLSLNHSPLNACRSKESSKIASNNTLEKEIDESEETSHKSVKKTKVNEIRQTAEFQNKNAAEDCASYLNSSMQNQKYSLESSSSVPKNLPPKAKTSIEQEDVQGSAVLKSPEMVCLETQSSGKQSLQDSDGGECRENEMKLNYSSPPVNPVGKSACKENDFPSKTDDLHVISTGQGKSSNSSKKVNTIENEEPFLNESEKSALPQSVSSVTLMLLQKQGVNITTTSKRITRSKARAMANSGKAVLSVKMAQRKINESCRKSARSSIKQAVKCLSSAARKQEASNEVMKSAQNPGVILTNTKTFITKVTKPIELGEKKLLEQKKREQREKEAERRREEILRKKTEEKKKKLLEKTRQVLHNREILEKGKQKPQKCVAKEKDVKLNILLKDKEEKKKCKMLDEQQKQVEVKQRVEAEAEAARITKQKQETLLRKLLIEEAKRDMANDAKENRDIILREKIEQKSNGKALKPVPNVQKPNLNATYDKITADLNAKSSNSASTIAQPINNAYYLDDLISDDSDDQENAPTKKTARWAKRSILLRESYYQLELSLVTNKIFRYREDINISAIFPNKRLKRTSSARWDTPPRYSCLPKY